MDITTNPSTSPVIRGCTLPNKDGKYYLKKIYRKFWDDYLFKYKWTTEQWVTNYTGDSTLASAMTGTASLRLKTICRQIPVKLELEGKISEAEKNRILSMLRSEDKESVYMAFVIMKKLSGRKM